MLLSVSIFYGNSFRTPKYTLIIKYPMSNRSCHASNRFAPGERGQAVGSGRG